MLTAVSFIFVFGLIVFFHELGHFLLARINDVTVHEFSLGMGPKILSKQGKETLYVLRIFPIGGYVRMEGEDEESDVEGSFSSKKPLNRLSIIAAGPVMNFLLSIVLLITIFSFLGIPSNVIDSFTQDSPASEAGLLVGDKIIEINNAEIKSWNDVNLNIRDAKGEVNVIVNRDGTIIEKNILPIEEETGRLVIGIYSKFTKNPVAVVSHSISQVLYLTKEIFKFFAMLPFGGISEGAVVGPVGIVNLVGQAAERSILDLLFLAAYISINLGIVNLLPIPALDGGRIVFILFELLRGKPVDPEKEGFVHLVGFVVLLSLMVFLVFKDIKGLF
ncbi:MAG: RIP metalloprotease RseP [Bacillota bacterium]|nr:RIP metalloprotease RseP [Bacillota bacterium]